jgi:uncharacterized membrane protein YeaQ/YmgE (transglycosylase-associated protein family)
MELVVQLVAGLVGGNAAGAALKNLSLGTLGNSIVGLLGGAGGGYLLSMFGGAAAGDAAAAASGMDIGSIIQNVLSGGVGGGVLMAILGAVKKMIAK